MCGLVNALGVMLLQCLFKLPDTSQLINNNNSNNNNNNKTCSLCLNKCQAVVVEVHAFLTSAPAGGQSFTAQWAPQPVLNSVLPLPGTKPRTVKPVA